MRVFIASSRRFAHSVGAPASAGDVFWCRRDVGCWVGPFVSREEARCSASRWAGAPREAFVAWLLGS